MTKHQEGAVEEMPELDRRLISHLKVPLNLDYDPTV